MYRFRSIQKLFDFKELENQEIYFSSPKELNDPAEGYFEIYWDGDIILWKNFFSHYIYCFREVMMLERLNIQLTEEHIPYLKSFKNPNLYGSSLNIIRENFFENETVIKIIEKLEELKFLKKYTVVLLLKCVTPFIKILIEDSIDKEYHMFRESSQKLMDSFLKIITFEHIEHEVIHEDYYFNELSQKGTNLGNESFINYFHFIYIENLNKMIFTTWYVACFIKDKPKEELDYLMWSHYGDGHKGVCLEFDENISLSGKHVKIEIECNDVIYTNATLHLNFFDHVAINNYNQKSLKETWYTDEKGNISGCFNKFVEKLNVDLNNMNSIRNEIVNRKTEVWLYEDEKRIAISDILSTYSTPNDRKFKYDFNNLKSITFGEKTSNLDKAKIIEIINKKCIEKGREDFNFYQAHIDPKTKLMKTIQIKTKR